MSLKGRGLPGERIKSERLKYSRKRTLASGNANRQNAANNGHSVTSGLRVLWYIFADFGGDIVNLAPSLVSKQCGCGK